MWRRGGRGDDGAEDWTEAPHVPLDGKEGEEMMSITERTDKLKGRRRSETPALFGGEDEERDRPSAGGDSLLLLLPPSPALYF